VIPSAPSPYTFIRTATQDQIERADFPVFVFHREEIEKHQIGPAIDRLMVLTDNDETARALEGRLMLVIEGYESDPREFYEIPECVAFVRAVTEEWPQWFHFLEPDEGSLGLLMCLLVDHMTTLDGGGNKLLKFANEQVHERVAALRFALDCMHDRLEFDEENRALARAQIMDGLRLAGFDVRDDLS